MKVLLLDDESAVRSALRLVLEEADDGTTILEASTLDELLQQTAEQQPDLALVDWEMVPQPMNGFVPALRTTAPGMRVVALSGRPEHRQGALAAGANAFAYKGDPPERLIDLLRSMGVACC